ncbi:glycoside hydrolase family 28 protein [Pseudomonas sp. M47T1]|uniref:glycoside hydrolase family 28 protein n=1 Tax=Pseudomonas sp. M47T1 TaxID=1179778 RepID=UPI0005BDD61F|nr:glycoside hydrolase family 28 protein [Pseudomonas sp. M47T1]
MSSANRIAAALFSLLCSQPLWAVEAPTRLQVPTLAYDDHQIMLVWDKPSAHADIKDYHVYANGTLLGSANANYAEVSPASPYVKRFYQQDTAGFHQPIGIHSFTAQGLTPNTAYGFTVRAVGADGKESADSPMLVHGTAPVAPVFDVRRYGAIGDGEHLDTAAIQRAIDACTRGGKVLLPKGVYKSGALYLKSNMTLEIAKGATLLGSERAEDYPLKGYAQYSYSTTQRPASLINAVARDPHQPLENIRIVGRGILDGNGWKRSADVVDPSGHAMAVYAASNNARYQQDGVLAKAQVDAAVASGMDVTDAYGQMRSSLITLSHVNNVFYGGLTLVNPAFHGIMNLETRNVVLANTSIRTYDANNGDGVEFSNSRGAMVFNNFFATGDDCVNFAAGTGADAAGQPPQENVWIFDNYFYKGHGMVVVGSHTGAWIQNILAEDNVGDGTDTGLRMKSTSFMGGGGRNITFRDSALRNIVKQAFIFTLDYNDPNAKLDFKPAAAGQFRDIHVSAVSVQNTLGTAIEVKGDNQRKAYHQGLVFKDVRFSGAAKVHIDGLKDSRFEGVEFSGNGGVDPWQVSHSHGLVFEHVTPTPASAEGTL